MKTFDVFDSPLQGTVLIEAGAGTGKTYTITGLYIRLVVEKGLPVERILVVTFTEAATDELKGRIRERLREALSGFRSGRAQDRFLKTLVDRFGGNPLAVQRLEDAIRSFDQAAIFTIHGFCLRMLGEHAFESGFLFNTELTPEQETRKREIAEDHWRRQVYPASRLFVNYLLHRGISPETLLKQVGRHLIHPRLRIIPRMDFPDTSAAEKAFETAREATASTWQANRETLTRILLQDTALNRKRYSPAAMQQAIRHLDALGAHPGNDPDLFPELERLTRTAIEAGVKKKQTPPSHPFFDLCETLLEHRDNLLRLFDQRLTALTIGLFEYLQRELARRNHEQNVRGFDDLLTQLHQALVSDTGLDLAAAIRRTYGAALIDEFQDTDLLQYGIFNRVFNQEECLLFLIGDPKQAVYGFRGADIFAYLEAAAKVDARFTLKENWRSDPTLIQTLNLLFQRPAHPFVFSDIRYEPAVAPADKTESEGLLEDGGPQCPFRLWFLGSGEGTKPLSKRIARERIVRAVAGEIARLLSLSRQGLVTVDKRALAPGDMAVLVRRNREAERMREALARMNIPAVMHSSGNIFQTNEALEMELLLRGVLFPDNIGAVKAAMTTDLFGVSGDELARMEDREDLLEERAAAFREYHELWRQEGFIRMFRRLMRAENMLLRLMAFPDGERRSTNVAQLTDLLHQESRLEKNRMEGLLQWLSRRRDPEQPDKEEHQLRLESDAHAVKLITMHKSKGLEFPIVFCPFTWDGSKLGKNREAFTFHSHDVGGDLVLDLGSDDADIHRQAAERELLAENLRLFYVALTRAKNRCYLFWGHFSDAQSSAPAYLLHSDGVASGTSDDLYRELIGLAREAPEVIQVAEMPENGEFIPFLPNTDPPDTACRAFTRRIKRAFRIASFSSFVHRHPHAGEMADRDAVGATFPSEPGDFPVGPSDRTDIFSFPKGAKPGTCLHAIFEEIDFTTQGAAGIGEVVAEKLRDYRFDSSWEPGVTAMVQKVLSVPLEPGVTDLCLERIGAGDRIPEMEFYFPLKPIRPQKLQQIFRRHPNGRLSSSALDRLGQLDAGEIRGYMKGFVDLVFCYRGRYYIVDWKSNHLGNRPEDYHPARLDRVMADELYFLQHHIYTVALRRYLDSRLPGFDYNTHFGGVFYLFLRGVEPRKDPRLGVYRDKPEEGLIRELTEYLLDGS